MFLSPTGLDNPMCMQISQLSRRLLNMSFLLMYVNEQFNCIQKNAFHHACVFMSYEDDFNEL